MGMPCASLTWQGSEQDQRQGELCRAAAEPSVALVKVIALAWEH